MILAPKIGILGGTFDPIHLGHLIIAQEAGEYFGLDEVIFIPARQAPLKAAQPVASAQDRLEMTRLAVADNPRFSVSDLEFRGEPVSYSIDTARRLQAERPDAELYWIIGADQRAQLRRWREIEQLVRIVRFIAFERHYATQNPDPPENAPAIGGLRLHTAPARLIDISSTEIRQRLEKGRDAKYFLPAATFDYIKARNLYR